MSGRKVEPWPYLREQLEGAPYYRRGEPSGMIFCPKRLSEIAVMRCGEYQMRDGCGFGCKQKASVDAIVEARAAMRVDEDRPSPLNCAMCGAAKETDKGRYCRRCRSSTSRFRA